MHILGGILFIPRLCPQTPGWDRAKSNHSAHFSILDVLLALQLRDQSIYLLFTLKLKGTSLTVSRKVLLNQFIRACCTGGADDDGGSLCSKILHGLRAHVPCDDNANPQIVKPIG